MMLRRLGWTAKVGGGAVALLLAFVFVASLGRYTGFAAPGKSCKTCHQIEASYAAWAGSSHRNMACKECHGSAFGLDVAVHRDSLRHLYYQVAGRIPERVRFEDRQVDRIMANCERCHMNTAARWRAGGHSAGYAHIFLSEKLNRRMQPNDDCLRCHGMFADGTIRDVVTPIDNKGPWRLVSAEMAERPAIPCIACHQMHSTGTPLRSPDYARPQSIAHAREVRAASLGFYDRRERRFFGIEDLPLPAMSAGGRAVVMSPDRRQANCYQCHTPAAAHEVGTSDDRTGAGVHEGIGCLGCHDAHTLEARSSCANCHPRLSNCGPDVATMDTTFRSPASRYNIHRVACGDCHTRGIPVPKDGSRRARSMAASLPASAKRGK
jgi:hypothetical protein